MIKLYGVKPSNYYSLAKAILLEKGLDFEEIVNPPSQEEDFLQKSPMGKMPAIEVDGQYLSETLAIARYAEMIAPEPALWPSDPFAAAKATELACHVKLDVELVARRCLPAAFFGQTASEEVQESTREDLVKGMKAVARLYKCAPFAAGPEFTIADLYTFYSFSVANGISQKMFQMDLLEDYPQIAKLIGELATRPSIAQVELDKAA